MRRVNELHQKQQKQRRKTLFAVAKTNILLYNYVSIHTELISPEIFPRCSSTRRDACRDRECGMESSFDDVRFALIIMTFAG